MERLLMRRPAKVSKKDIRRFKLALKIGDLSPEIGLELGMEVRATYLCPDCWIYGRIIRISRGYIEILVSGPQKWTSLIGTRLLFSSRENIIQRWEDEKR